MQPKSSNAPSINQIKAAVAYSDDDLDTFQRELTREKIIEIWKKMREGGNSKDGILTRDKFKQIMLEHFRHVNLKDSLINDIFERFRKKDYVGHDKYDKRRVEEKRGMNFGDPEKGDIDLHDLVVSLAVLSLMDYDEKLELCFDLTDIDEDGCLSPDDVCKMILAIERNFAKECSFIDSDNASSLNYVATKKAMRRFHYLFLFEGQEDPKGEGEGKARKDKILGHFKDFMEKLSNKHFLYENLLPKNYSMRRVLDNKAKEVAFKIHKNEEDHFRKFRADLHGKLWGKSDLSDARPRQGAAKKEDVAKIQNKEPGDVLAYGVRTIEEETRYEENRRNNEGPKHREPIIQERSNLPDFRKKVREMREKEVQHIDQLTGSKYEKMLKKKENHLPMIGKWPDDELKHVEIEAPDLSSMIEKRVERLKKQYKHLDPNYKDYLLKKLTSAANGETMSRTMPSSRKIQAYKFLM